MNTGADPVGYKLMSRQLAGLREAGGTTAELLEGNQRFLQLAAFALVALAGLALLAALHAARFIAVPVVAGVVLGLIIGPVGDRAKARGIPKSVTFALLVLGFVSVMVLAAWLALPVVQLVVAALPDAGNRLRGLMDFVQDWMRVVDNLRNAGHAVAPAVPQPAAIVPQPAGPSTVDVATTAVTIVSPAVSQVIIFLFSLTLFLASRAHWRTSLARLFVEREHRLQALKRFSAIENQLTDYFLTVTGINLGLAILVSGAFWLAGIPGALSWGVLAFLLNFLPVVGPLFLKVALLAFGGLIYPDLPNALLPFGMFLAISLVEANLVTPKIVGARITMEPLTVFLSVVFFTWLWGFAGAFLAMPLLAIGAVAFRREEEAQRLPS